MDKFKIKILNPEEVKDLFKTWGTFSCKCYDTPVKYAERVGKSCLESGHFSGSRSVYINIDVSGVPRALIDQIVRKEQGCVKNVESGRYVDFSNFDYYTSPLIANDEIAKEIYDKHMEATREAYKKIVERLNEKGIKGEKAYEAARGVSPMNYRTGMVIGLTVEALISLCHNRLCVRTQEHSRRLIRMIRDEVVKLVPELKEYLVIKCEYLQWCPEGKKCCGYKPTREQFLEIINNHKEENKTKEYIKE